MVCHSLLQWTTFCQNSPPWPGRLGWHYMAWLIVSLSPCHQIGLFSVIMFFSLSALLWRRTRGLWKLPDGRDWLRGKLEIVLLGPCLVQFSSVQSLGMSDSLWPHGLQHTRPHCPSPTSRVYSHSCPLRHWCHPSISSSVIPFSSCLQFFPASGSFQISLFFTSGGQCTGVSASASFLPMNIQDWFPLLWTSWISLQSRGLSSVFLNTTVQKYQFFTAQLSL